MRITHSGTHSLPNWVFESFFRPMICGIFQWKRWKPSLPTLNVIRPNWYMAISTGCWNAIRTSSGTPVWIRDQTKAVKTHSCVQWSLPTRKPLPPIWMAFSLRKIYHSFIHSCPCRTKRYCPAACMNPCASFRFPIQRSETPSRLHVKNRSRIVRT